MFIFGIML